jgi:calcineurin-like phosphoesterase family protein
MNSTNRTYKVFFTSDLHFGHKNIIAYCQRPFFYVEEMNEALIANWNAVVGPNDKVYIIGDISMSYSKTRLKEIFDRLNGIKILIRGNHDRTKNIPKECFEQVVERLHLIEEDCDFILVHDPAEASANHMSKQKYLCGHLHSSKDRRIYYNWIDVGVDANDYAPISLEEILKLFEDEATKGLSANELLQRSASSYNQYVQRRSDTTRTPDNV